MACIASSRSVDLQCIRKSLLYKKAPTRPARPRTKLPAPTIFSAPLLAVVLAEAEAEAVSVVLVATFTAPLDPVVAPEAVAAFVVVTDTAEDTALEIALEVVVGYCEALEQYVACVLRAATRR